MKNRKNMAKIFSLFALSLPIAVSISSCASHKEVFDNSSTNSNTPSFDSTKKGTIPSSLANLNSNIITNFTYISSNEYGVTQNYQDFSDNYSLKSYTGSSSGIKKDINYFGYLIWNQNAKSFTISDINLNNYEINDLDSSSNVVFGQTKISFDLNITIVGIQNTTINILDKSYNIVDGKTYTLNISVKNQTIESCVNSLIDEFLVGWKVKTANISFDNETYTSEFVPSSHSFSFSFPYKVKNLTSKKNYLQLYSQYESNVLDISKNDLKKQIEEKFNTEYQQSMDYIENGIGVIGVLASNPTVKDLIYQSIPYITKILVSSNILPSYLSPLINDALGDSSKSFLEVIQENKSVILRFLEENLGSVSSVAETYLDLFKPNISSSSSEYKSIKSFFTTLGLSDDVQDVIFKDVIGVDGSTPLSLIDFIYNNLDLILSLIDPSYNSKDDSNENSSSDSTTSDDTTSDNTTTNTTQSAIITILKLLLSKNTETDQYNKFFDVLSGSEKTEFYNAIVQLFGQTNTQITSILSLITESNENFTTKNIITFISSLYTFAKDMFERNDNYSSFKDKNAYKNITFYTKFEKEPTIDKSSKTISFSYKIYYTLNKKIDFSPVIAAFKNLLSVNTVSSLIKEFTSTDLDSILGNIPVVGEFAKARVIKALLQYIPDKIWLGADSGDSFYKNNQTTVTYFAENSNLWFYPIKNGINYKLGYKFQYNQNIKMDDPSFVQSITSNYNSKTNAVSLMNINVSNSSWSFGTDISVDFYFFDFWKQVLQNVILRDYDFSEIFTSYAVDDTNIATINDYSSNLYITGFALKNTISTIDTKTFINDFAVDNSNTTQVISDFMTPGALYAWKDGTSNSIYGLKPKLSSSLESSLTSQMYSLVDETNFKKMSENTNLTIGTSINPILNFNLPVKVKQTSYGVDVDIKVRMTIVNFSAYSPVMFYDTTSNSLIDNLYYQIMYIA